MWITTKEAAETLNKSVRTIQRMVKTGKLQGKEVLGLKIQKKRGEITALKSSTRLTTFLRIANCLQIKIVTNIQLCRLTTFQRNDKIANYLK
ncbi:MAG: hypothetical protein B7C24_14300 [Bacteroidetes bacterium 4572_77]|nr:MAG: hypothetical protein B7C24_14300 [Bacteroidetes bacterium 4572_77]